MTARQSSFSNIFNSIKNFISYFGNRFDHNDILVMYRDKKFKAAKVKFCVYLEMRMFGAKLLKDFGIYAVQDLIDFDHEKLWDKLIDLRDAHYTKLGRLLFEEEVDVSDSSLRRYGQQFVRQYTGLQELLMKHPGYSKALPPIKNRRMFESRLNQVLG